jgi:polyvinyl alcohol dehydrogenase (cytochrome)
MRAYSTRDGTILWTFDTNREFTTVNGVKANGGGLEGPGAVVAGGMLFFNSGYGGFIGNGGNVLLAFGID